MAERRQAPALEQVALGKAADSHACEVDGARRRRKPGQAALSAHHCGGVDLGRSRAAGGHLLGAPPWRCRPGSASVAGTACRLRCEGSTQPGASCPAAAPGVSCPRLRAAVDATLRSAIRIVSGDAPHRAGCSNFIRHPRFVVNIFIRIVDEILTPHAVTRRPARRARALRESWRGSAPACPPALRDPCGPRRQCAPGDGRPGRGRRSPSPR